MRLKPCRYVVMLFLAVCSISACGRRPGSMEMRHHDGIEIAFADQERPDVFGATGMAVRATDDAEAGYWGIVEGLRRPERAVVRLERADRSVVVSLFSGNTGRTGALIRLSPQAADAIGLLDEPQFVLVVAVRREPHILLH
jgi:hypothetical protein